ncbi:hypothetical protein Cph01nite_22600 [Cellulomonas phragmiteti]|uniref:Uncharacterized protein n=1 Tax=Cellulomonas phragmiteti TaxID=478780 RepID=A0ABQ4DMD2_9CELL|nr:hypothetical protein Cph01nite_22600 [Cellulomonas phragmiteti]
MNDSKPSSRSLHAYAFDQDPDGFTRDDMLPADGILDIFLTAVLGYKDTDASVGITVSIGGALVSGTAIPRGRWQQLWFDSMRAAAPGLTTALEPHFDRQLDATAEVYDRRDKAGLPIPALKHLHLRDVTMWNTSQQVHLPIWRARLDRLDGWSIGTLGPS